MKNSLIVITLITVMLLAGCANQGASSSTSQMTQAISASSQVVPSSSASASSASSQEVVVPPQSSQEALAAYAQAKAQEEATDIEIDLLEANFRIGQVTSEEFQNQKISLEQQKAMYELQADQQEVLIPMFQPEEGWVDTSNPEALFTKTRELKPQEDALELELERLELEYASGNITRDEFLQQSEASYQQVFLVEQQLDWLEDMLELMGYDD